MEIDIVIVVKMELCPVSLRCHEVVFDLVLSEVLCIPTSHIIVFECISKIVKCHIFNSASISVLEIHHFWSSDVIKLSKMSSCHQFNTIAD